MILSIGSCLGCRSRVCKRSLIVERSLLLQLRFKAWSIVVFILSIGLRSCLTWLVCNLLLLFVVKRCSQNLSLIRGRHNCRLISRIVIRLIEGVRLELLLNLVTYHTHQTTSLLMWILLVLSSVIHFLVHWRYWSFILSSIRNLN